MSKDLLALYMDEIKSIRNRAERNIAIKAHQVALKKQREQDKREMKNLVGRIIRFRDPEKHKDAVRRSQKKKLLKVMNDGRRIERASDEELARAA